MSLLRTDRTHRAGPKRVHDLAGRLVTIQEAFGKEGRDWRTPD